ncbi:MAG: hypothetical protein VXY16_07400 [Pseudomonadota bacterium]|nr:hypothetical protein [Pseudomonadota bacterium]
MRILFLTLFLVITTFSLPTAAQMSNGTDTDFKITVKSRDAKFIGTSMGGARVMIVDKRTGDTIVEGVTTGGTGDTATIMKDTYERNPVYFTDGAAKFEFSLEILEPMPVTVTATAPLAQGQSLATVSEDMILIPLKDYTTGNGIMLELPGFAVDVLSPPAHRKLPHSPDRPITVTANVIKMCGCHIAEDSPWPPENYEVEAHVYVNSLYITSTPLEFTGEPGIYETNLKIPQPGTFRIVVTAFDPVTKEGGMDTTTIVLEKQKEPASNEQQ